MKIYLQKVIVFLCCATLFVGCDKDLYEDQIQQTFEPKTSYVAIDKVPFLIPSIQQFNNDYLYLTEESKGKVMSKEGLDLNLNLGHILEYVAANGLKSYSVSIEKEFQQFDDIYFENLHIYEKDGGYEKVIFKYNPIDDTVKFDLNTFTGDVELFDIDYTNLGVIQYVNGDKVCVKITVGCLHVWDFGGGNIMMFGDLNCGNNNPDSNPDNGFDSGVDWGTSGSSSGTSTSGGTSSSGDHGSDLGIITIVPNPVNINQSMRNRKFEQLIIDHNLSIFWNAPSNSVIRTEIMQYLNTSLTNDLGLTTDPIEYPQVDVDFALEVINLVINDSQEEEAETLNNVVKMILVTERNNYFTNPLNQNYANLIDPFTEVDLQTLWPLWQIYFSSKCAILKFQHPSWSMLKVYWEASKEMIHLGLDIVGLVPVIGEVADLTNGVIYTTEGDGVNATLSYASTIPVVGWFTTGAKMAIKTVNITATTVTTLKWYKTAGGLISFGNSGQLRKILNLLPGNPLQAHHLMPWALKNHNVIQKAAKSGNVFHMNQALNGIAVAAWRNQPNHTAYNNLIYTKLQDFNSLYPSATAQECYEFLTDLIQQIRTWVINNPNSHLNDLVLP
jgi:hypothetical protein